MNKSGIASKKTLVTGACVVDSGYDGEVFIDLHNIGNDNQRVVEGQKIAQAVLVPIIVPSLEEIEEDNIYGKLTVRGTGGFGSTGDT
jgi:dUTPase